MSKGRPRGAISLVTGVVARSKSKRQHSDAEDRNRARTFRAGMQAALLRARAIAKGDQAEKFFSSAEQITLFEANRFARQPIGFDYLENLQEPDALPLEQELEWLSYRISANAASLSRFVNDKQRIEDLFVRGEFGAALRRLEEHMDEAGASIWSVSLKIALLQVISGIDAQKAFVSDIRAKFKHAVLPYLVNAYSQRAEDGISIGYFLENARRRLDRMSNQEIATYLRYKIDGLWPESHASISTVLRLEQNHHEIDIYETFLDALQHIATIGFGGKLRKAAKEVSTRIEPIDDFRIAKLLTALGDSKFAARFEVHNSNAVNELLRGNVKASLIRARKTYREHSGSLPCVLVGALAASHGRKHRREARLSGESIGVHRFFSQVVNSLVPIVQRGAVESEVGLGSTWDAKKLGHALGGLALFHALRSLADAEESNTFEAFGGCVRRVALRTREISMLDAFGRDGVSPELIASSSDLALQDFLYRLQGRQAIAARQLSVGGLRDDAASFADACCNLSLNEIEAVEVAVQEALSSPSRVLASHAASIALEAYAVSGLIGESAKLVTFEHVNRGTNLKSLPVGAIFEGVDWAQIEEHASTISMSIALFLYAQLGGEDTTHSYRCFSLETFLQARGVKLPSELRDQVSEFDSEQLSFFLGRVCEWSLLDMLPPIGSTRAVLEERRDICALLLQMDGGCDKELYRQELLAVTKELTVQQGLQTIDGSRVHVDIDSLRVSLRRELAESYNRYISLIKQGIGVSENFDAVLRDIAKQEGQPKYLLSMPQNEADELLFTMIRQVRERFLFDIPHGLDSYLSKRIRHGSIVGYLRGPAEKEGIIASQNLDGSYKPSGRWKSLVDGSPYKGELEAVLQSFARSFDGHLLRLKDVLLHVKSEHHPLGVFDAPIGPPLFHLIRSVTSRDASLQAFVDTLLASLWGLLNPSLSSARDLLQKDTARALSEMFDSLRGEIHRLVPNHQDRVELEMAAGRASVGVQAAVQTVAAWFTPIEGEDLKYSMEEVVDIALASVRAISVSFAPILSVDEERPLRIERGVMLLLVDALFIALHNIARWCGSLTPSVRVSARGDTEANILRIRVVNSVVGVSDWDVAQKQVAELKGRLFTPEGREMARREGGSGLFKLATITGQSDSGRLDFGFVSPKEFFLEFDLSLLSLGDDLEDTDR